MALTIDFAEVTKLCPSGPDVAGMVFQAVRAGEAAVPEAVGVYIPSFAKSAGTPAK